MPAETGAISRVADQEPSQFLGPTSISSDHIQQAFRDYLKDDDLKLEKADAQVIGAGQGFTSYVVRITLTWSEADQKRHHSDLPKSVIVKALSKESCDKLWQKFLVDQSEEASKPFTDMLTMAHATECSVYDMFHSLDHQPVPIARAYATWLGDDTRPPLILLEDLSDRGRVLGDPSESLNKSQVIELARTLADLHAWSLSTQVPWQTKFPTIHDRLALFQAFIPMLKQGLQSAKQTFPDLFSDLDEDKFMKMFTPDDAIRIHTSHKQFIPDVLIHGDFWANNVMYNKLPDGSMGNEMVAFIDWQMSMVGHPMTDLGRLMSMSVDQELRVDHLEEIIQNYYDTLKSKLGDKFPKEFTFEKALELAREHTALNCVFLLIMQDTMANIFASTDGPDSEARRARLFQKARDSFTYAKQFLDITTDKEK